MAALLNKLLIEQTKSRPRHSNDNGLAESKNGAVVRKHMGYTHIDAQHATEITDFYREYLNPYLNFHRPCGVPEMKVNAKGKQKRVYRWYATPWEILRQLPDVVRFLKPGVTVEQLEIQARAKTDTQAAQDMQEAKRKLFEGFNARTRSQAAVRLPLVGLVEIGQQRSKNKTTLRGDATQSVVTDRLPLVGPVGIGKQLSKNKTTLRAEATQSVATDRLPLVGPGKPKSKQKRRP